MAIDVNFSLLSMKDNYSQPDPLPGAIVRPVLGAGPDWQNPTAGRKFVTDDKGEAHFTMDGLIDMRWRSRNVGFTPFSIPVRSEHMQIATELEHKLPAEKEGEYKTFRWVLTMDLDCFKEGTCSTSGLMGIYTPDSQGRFTKALARQGGNEAWKVPELNDKVIWGMNYQVADFLMTTDPADQKKRNLQLAFKRMPPAILR
jgi:hypothetical protein